MKKLPRNWIVQNDIFKLKIGKFSFESTVLENCFESLILQQQQKLSLAWNQKSKWDIFGNFIGVWNVAKFKQNLAIHFVDLLHYKKVIF